MSRRAAKSPRSGVGRGRLATVLAVGALVVASALWTQRADGPGSGLAAIEGDDPGVVHVHGLGVDPGDGVLYAATHLGLFRIPERGRAVRVANRYQDTMGFTITGPRTFLGSGHPDLREESLPPLLGLIESTDRGETWQSVSLLGEVDFHALHAAHGNVYGFDASSGTFMFSEDGKSWARRASLPLRDFAVSPVSPQTVIATTEGGAARSTDGGVVFQAVPSPALAYLAWVRTDELIAVSPSGDVLVSANEGASWDRRGQVEGEPAALTSTGSRLYVAVHDRGIYQSDDGGRTWSLRYRDPA